MKNNFRKNDMENIFLYNELFSLINLNEDDGIFKIKKI